MSFALSVNLWQDDTDKPKSRAVASNWGRAWWSCSLCWWTLEAVVRILWVQSPLTTTGFIRSFTLNMGVRKFSKSHTIQQHHVTSHCFALLLPQFIIFWVLKFVVVECFVFCWNRVESIEGCIIEIAQVLDMDHELIEIVKKGDGQRRIFVLSGRENSKWRPLSKNIKLTTTKVLGNTNCNNNNNNNFSSYRTAISNKGKFQTETRPFSKNDHDTDFFPFLQGWHFLAI